MWITRDELYDKLVLWLIKPERMLSYWGGVGRLLILDKTDFPEITWKNEPIEVNLEYVYGELNV